MPQCPREYLTGPAWRATSGTRQARPHAASAWLGQKHCGQPLLASRVKGRLTPPNWQGTSRDAILTADVVLELFDDELLLDNNRLDEIAN